MCGLALPYSAPEPIPIHPPPVDVLDPHNPDSPMTRKTIGFVGGGNMARSLIGGLLAAGTRSDVLIASDPDEVIRMSLTSDFGIQTTADNADIVTESDVLILAVKPQVVEEALTPLSSLFATHRPLVISIAAGIPITSIEKWAKTKLAVIRVMPNTPALIGAGAAGLFANGLASPEQRATAESIIQSVGTSIWVNDEGLIDTVTAVSGSGPAYFFYLMDAMIEAATEGGLDSEAARTLVLETALGASRLALSSDESPAELRKRVTSPGGTTEAAVKTLTEDHCSESIIRAVHAARLRSIELAQSLGDQ